MFALNPDCEHAEQVLPGLMDARTYPVEIRIAITPRSVWRRRAHQ
tara:strand:+ start:3209 stop:3343 length:135 start_codon:yes stop_codon:yes gene_type:complete